MASATHTAEAKRSSTASRAVAHTVQAKLKVGPTNDSYEQEADRVADRVVSPSTDVVSASAPAAAGAQRMPIARAVASHPVVSNISRVQRMAEKGKKKEEPQAKLQRQEEEEPQAKLQRQEEEPQAKLQRQEEEPQAKLQRQEAQPKLQRQEEEEQMQTKLQRQEEEEAQPKLQRQEEEEAQPKLQRQEEEEAQPKLQRQEEEETQPKLQRQEEEEAQPKLQRQEEEEAQPKLQRQEEEVQEKKEPRANVRDKGEFPVIGRVEDTLFERKGKGEPLDKDLRLTLEAQFGVDFSKVRIHTDGDAVRMSREMKAQAFTHGSDIFFNEGKYDPDSLSGKILLAHELTHVVQQGAAETAVSEAKVDQNNAKKDQPGPDPPDAKAAEAQEKTNKIEEQSAAEGEAGGEASAAPGEAQAAEGEAADKEGADKEGAAEEEAAAGKEKAEKGKAEKGKAKKGKAGKGKGKKKGGGKGIGAFLRQSTKAVFEKKKGAVTSLATNEKNKEDATAKLAQTEKAVVPPAEEGQSRSNASQVETVEQQPEPEANEEQAKQQFEASLDNAVPSSLEEVDEFKEEGKGRVVGEAVKGVVVADTQEVQATYKKIEETPAPEPDAVPEELPPLEEAPETPELAMGEGVVGEVQPEHTDLSEFENESDKLIEDQPIPEEELEKVDEGDLAEAMSERKKVKQRAKEGPEEVKQLETQQKQKVNEELKNEEVEGRKKMKEERQKELLGAQEDQKKTKGTIEEKRLAVTDKINGIYETANTTVQQKLEDLEKTSLADFDKGQAAATKTFEDNVKRRIDQFKDNRYSGLFGWAKWLKDKLLGMDKLPGVKAIFDTEKATFITNIDQLIKKITEENKRVIQECKDIVADAKKEIKEFVDGLGPELKKTGEEVFTQMKDKLDALDKKINDKEKELQKKLAEKREAAIKAIEEKIDAMKEEMSGLVGKLGNLLLEVALKFFKWALKKAGLDGGQLMGIIDKGKTVIKKIISDPIAFIGNVVKAVKGGIDNFVKNIKKHLISGLISWLTGAMADVPIQLPDKWDLKGILHLILQILGLTYDRIRVKLVKRLGEKVVGAVEKTVEIVKVLITKGPIGLWEMIKEKATEIKEQVMTGIRDWLITEVVKQAIIKVVSFLNPAGAIVQAIIAIYNTVMFFVENWQRIVSFVESVFNSIGDIAMGKLSAASQKVEQAMAMTIPIILNFLARLIGLGSIGKKVSEIIKKVRKPIDKIVDKVVDKIAGLAKKVGGKTKAGAKALKEKGLALIKWWTKKKSFKGADGQNHSLYLKKKGKSYELTMASVPQRLRDRLANVQQNGSSADKKKVKTALGYVSKIDKQIILLDTLKPRAVRDPAENKRLNKEAQTLDKLLAQLSGYLKSINMAEEILDLPTPSYTFTMEGGKAKTAIAEKLSANRRMGAKPGDFPEGWAAIREGLTKGGGHWKRLHLVNEKFGGLGNKENLVPGTAADNSTHETLFESKIKRRIGRRPNDPTKKDVVWMKAVVTYFGSGVKTYPSMPSGTQPKVTDYADKIEFTAGRHVKAGKSNWRKESKSSVAKLTLDMDPPDWNLVLPPKIISATPSEYRTAAKAGRLSTAIASYAFTPYIVSIIKSGTYTAEADLYTHLDTEIAMPRRHKKTKSKLRAAKRFIPHLFAAKVMELK